MKSNEKLDYFAHLLLKWNKVHSLTKAKDIAKIKDYIEDSLYPLEILEPFKNCLDIGTGAGFPGLVLAIAREDISFTLTEPLNKKASFLNLVKCELDLKNVTIYQDRVENTPPFAYDLITSRAVSDTKILLDITTNHRDNHTTLLFYKGENVFNEVENLQNYDIIEKDKRNYLIIRGNN